MRDSLPESVKDALECAQSEYDIYEGLCADGVEYLHEIAGCAWDAVVEDVPSVGSIVTMNLCARWIKELDPSSSPWEIIVEQWETAIRGVHEGGESNEFNYLMIMRGLGEVAHLLLLGVTKALISQIGLVGACGIKWWGDMPPIDIERDFAFLNSTAHEEEQP